jgi:predicted nucleic acid-binding protein
MAGRDVFLDTSGFYALVDRRAGHHAAAALAAGRLARAGRRLVVTDHVVCESVNLANARGGSRLGARVLELLDQSVAMRLEWIGEDRFATTHAFGGEICTRASKCPVCP